MGVHAVPGVYGGWVVRRSHSAFASSRWKTKREAWRECRRLARGSMSIAYLHRKDGRIETRNSYEKP